MASKREQIVDAIVALLVAGAGGGIPVAERSRTFAVSVEAGKAIAVYWTKDDPTSKTSRYGPVRAWRLTVAIDLWAKSTDTTRPDEEIDPLAVYVVSKLDGLEGAPGAEPYMQITVGPIEPDLEQYDHGYCKATQYVYVDYQTMAGNLEA